MHTYQWVDIITIFKNPGDEIFVTRGGDIKKQRLDQLNLPSYGVRRTSWRRGRRRGDKGRTEETHTYNKYECMDILKGALIRVSIGLDKPDLSLACSSTAVTSLNPFWVEM